MKDHHGCPVQATINVLSGKWKVQAVWHLSFGPRRFTEMRNLLKGVSEKVLTAQLRELEKDEVLCRKHFGGPEEHLRYSLTTYGRTLVPILTHMAEWGAAHKERFAEKRTNSHCIAS